MGSATLMSKTNLLVPMVFGTLALFSMSAQGQPFPLKQVFGDSITLTQNTRGSVVEYCPDNTCDRFELSGKDSLPMLHDFVYLYLFAYGEYIYLKKFKSQKGAPYLAEIVARRKGPCTGTNEQQISECILSREIKGAPVRLFSVRYDEGQRCVVPEALLGVPAKGKASCTKVRGAP